MMRARRAVLLVVGLALGCTTAHAYLLTRSRVLSPSKRVCRRAVASRLVASDASLGSEYERVKAMGVADIKAELELRGVDYSGCFEKDELVRRLTLAREQGEADPSLVDKFNAESLERTFATSGEDAADADEAVDPFEVAADEMDSLPGGLSPEAVKKLASNPELMAILKNPRMQDVLKDVMENGPVAFAKYAGDAEVMKMIAQFQSAIGS